MWPGSATVWLLSIRAAMRSGCALRVARARYGIAARSARWTILCFIRLGPRERNKASDANSLPRVAVTKLYESLKHWWDLKDLKKFSTRPSSRSKGYPPTQPEQPSALE